MHYPIETLSQIKLAQAKKGRRKMQYPASNASQTLPTTRNGSPRTRRPEDVVYQIVTVAAILLVLGSLWVF